MPQYGMYISTSTLINREEWRLSSVALHEALQLSLTQTRNHETSVCCFFAFVITILNHETWISTKITSICHQRCLHPLKSEIPRPHNGHFISYVMIQWHHPSFIKLFILLWINVEIISASWHLDNRESRVSDVISIRMIWAILDYRLSTPIIAHSIVYCGNVW